MSKGYEKLKESVERDCARYGGEFHPDGCVDSCYGKCSCFHKYCNKFKWAIDRAKAYGEALGLNWEDILDSWENDRCYWYMSYYQECNQPEINVRAKVFETIQELNSSIGKKGFRCPSCGKVVNDPYECNVCGWKVYGLLGDLGKGVFVYVKEKLRGNTIFMPVSWEEELSGQEKGK